MAVELKEALEKLRKDSKKRKFEQTVDLFVNLKGVDIRKENINAVIKIPHKVKEKKICGFLTAKNELVKTITKPEFAKYKDKALLRTLVDEFDFFIAHGSLMPAVATTFGKALGPAGKMPSPQLGIVVKEDDATIKPLLERISKSVKIRAKEASIKVAAGKEGMTDEQIIDNIKAIYKGVENVLPTKRENVKNVKIKFTMSKCIEVEVKQ
jgi:large subunit ribosomal protein L1